MSSRIPGSYRISSQSKFHLKVMNTWQYKGSETAINAVNLQPGQLI